MVIAHLFTWPPPLSPMGDTIPLKAIYLKWRISSSVAKQYVNVTTKLPDCTISTEMIVFSHNLSQTRISPLTEWECIYCRYQMNTLYPMSVMLWLCYKSVWDGKKMGENKSQIHDIWNRIVNYDHEEKVGLVMFPLLN